MIAMTARPTVPLAFCLLVTVSGCASLQSATRTALGIGHKDMREAQRLARAERAAHISDEEIDRRLTFLTERLDERRLHAALWKYGWLTVDSAGGIASAARAGFDDGSRRVNDISQAGKAVIGVAYLLLNPMPGVDGADPVRAMPAASREDKLARLGRAEEILAREAERAHDRTSWLLHLGNVVVNAAASAAVLAYGNDGLALQSFLIGTGVGELQIWSQPWKGPADWEEYEQFVATGGVEPPTPTAEWRIVPQGLGVGVAARF